MQDMFEQAKRAATHAVERAAWEADRMRRVGARQREAELAERERVALLDQLGGVVLDLDKRGQLTQPALKALAQRLAQLRDEINHIQDDVQGIRKENFTPGSVSIQVNRPGAADTEPCPTCHQPVRKSAAYCPSCGARLR
ncbi:MAG TPA: zinc ribbon domain-containing protein [Ktedonobacterales bacterium]|nr:zinc ribbon domain-containing protein [Ktedonobacterales bacterium]